MVSDEWSWIIWPAFCIALAVLTVVVLLGGP